MSSLSGVLSSISPVVAEAARERATGDDKFLKDYLYFFELRIPASASVRTLGITTFFFPLVVNPESLSYGVPFAVDVAMTQGGGLFVEEQGIVQRSLRLRGQTGFKPRNMLGDTLQMLAQRETSSSARHLRPGVIDAISGMAQFQYLEDAVFTTYGDLKRDPATAKDTKLIFHDPKHDQHWLVVPQNFALEQSSSRPFTYSYSIDLLIVDKAEAANLDLSEDKSLLEQMKDALATVQAAIDLATGAIQDLTALVDDVKAIVKDIAKVVDTVSNVISAAKDFVNGVTALIRSPLAIISSTCDLIENGLSFYTNLIAAGKSITTIPDAVLQSIRQLQDALHLMGTHPEAFQTPAQAALEALRTSQQISQANTQAALDAASATVPPSTLAQAANLGTSLLPGDAARARAQVTAGAATKTFTGATQYTVSQGDTLVNLAAKFLGDARQWQYIAAANGLKPPYVDGQASQPLGHPSDDAALTGSIAVGSKILIPNTGKPPEAQPLLPVLGVDPGQGAAAHLLGSDLLLAPVGVVAAAGRSVQDQLDLVIDTDRGSTDFRLVVGEPNLVQGLLARLTIERGTDVLYQQVGIQRIVSMRIATLDLETVRFRVQESLSLDPRVVNVQKVSIRRSRSQPDVVYIDATVLVRGFTQPTDIRVAA